MCLRCPYTCAWAWCWGWACAAKYRLSPYIHTHIHTYIRALLTLTSWRICTYAGTNVSWRGWGSATKCELFGTYTRRGRSGLPRRLRRDAVWIFWPKESNGELWCCSWRRSRRFWKRNCCIWRYVCVHWCIFSWLCACVYGGDHGDFGREIAVFEGMLLCVCVYIYTYIWVCVCVKYKHIHAQQSAAITSSPLLKRWTLRCLVFTLDLWSREVKEQNRRKRLLSLLRYVCTYVCMYACMCLFLDYGLVK